MPGIGGTFLSSHDPKRLVRWFKDGLGIEMDPQGEGGMIVLKSGKLFSILSVQPARKDAPSPPPGKVEKEPYGRQTMMLNLRVDDMEATIARLKKNGDKVAGPVPYEGFGTFAWTRTPDGHDIELWQP